ncbi:LON peptidase N-terminal domain and RING finger protein 3 [Adelges cooleyi]|uniref:LON peptidase N-terminal domain and RING finger protein 3 n=1 Tax=Adelges cooleyi TaxID=133065 RepID=UPI00217F6381|nr:LON peptidase N-terminal domain and RING finger protein 3 [Adelges cooleyi]XP_050422194.1 LON peptidase N-terminal domain and RING finger protein 3 [Adelges cooleyi]
MQLVKDFMAEVATNDKFSSLYISAYDVGRGGGGGGGGVIQTAAADTIGDGVGHGFADVHRSMDAYVKCAESLAKCGKVLESLDLYVRCFQVGPLPANFLWQVSTSFLGFIRKQQILTAAAQDGTRSPPPPHRTPFHCGACDLVLRDPVTLHCGHTFCRQCVAGPCKPQCSKCGLRTSYQPHVNVLVKSLVEKLWPEQLRAAELLEEGKALLRQDKPHSALIKFNQAFYTGGENYELLNMRSRTLIKLGLNENALLDADRVVQMRPKWFKGHFTRGTALYLLGRYQEALFEFSLSTMFGENFQKLKPHISEVLQRLLVMYSKEMETPELENWDFITHGYLAYLNTAIGGPGKFEKPVNSFEKKEEDNCSKSVVRQLCETRSITELVRQIFAEISNNKYHSSADEELDHFTVNKSLLEESDFDCVLCCGKLLNPVTTACGHTYCTECLEHNFDYSFYCPLCLTSLPPSLALSKKYTTEFVEELINVYHNSNRLMLISNWKKEMEIQDGMYLPVFVCTNAFPSVSCPLHVFEPRYRLMIRRCIDSGSRSFAMISHCRPPMKFAQFGTMLEIKDRLMTGNGCSFLSTIGTRRFKVLGRKERDGYDMAKVEFIRDEIVPETKLAELRSLHDNTRRRGLEWFNDFRHEIKLEILRTVGFPPELEDNWEQLDDGPAWMWWLLSLLPLGLNAHVDLLANTSLEVRLTVINRILGRIEQSALNRCITSTPGRK